jgi:NitT/TauT family transport system substrate-binding protein
MKRHLILLTITVSAIAIFGCFFSCDRTDKKPVGPLEKVTIAYSATPDAGLAEVAQMQGYYLREGLDAVPQKYPLGKFALQALLDGKADFATVAETPFMFAVMKGEKISVIASIQTAKGNWALGARKDKGILSPEDLRGRKIATSLGASGEYFLDVFLAINGISKNEIRLVNLKPEEMLSRLINGDIDAISALSPVILQVQQKLGGDAIIFQDKDIYTQFFNVVATQEFIRNNPGKVKKLLLALVRAEEFINQNPAEAQKIVADFTGLDRTLLGEIWAVNDFKVTLNQSLLLALEDLSQWAIKNRLAKAGKVPQYLDFIYFDGLESVKPKAVRIIK